MLAALAAMALIAGSAESRTRKPPPPPPPPPPVGLSAKLVEQASAYRAYISRTAAISPAFANGLEVAQGVRVGASYQTDQLLRGAIVYGAIAALQDPGFVAGVRIYAADPTQRRQVAYEVMKDPAYALGFNGAAAAAGLVIAALGEDGPRPRCRAAARACCWPSSFPPSPPSAKRPRRCGCNRRAWAPDRLA